MSQGAYSRVPSTENTTDENKENTELAEKGPKLSRKQLKRQKRAEKAESYATKLHALIWIVLATAVAYFTDIVNVITRSTKVNRFWLNSSLILFTVATVLILYMAIYVPRVLKIHHEPQVYSPRMLPVTGIALILGVCGQFMVCLLLLF
eukprot:snap_masked-scaffold_35-processed-gene-1.38-mRNA-1 protein AED:0.08 eAED:0.16 QI:0/0/0/1/1/1/2/0/148